MSRTRTRAEIKQALDDLVAYVVETVPLDVPTYRFDGDLVATPEELSALTGIPVSEAEARMMAEYKDVYSSAAAHSSTVGVGTVIGERDTYERARRIAGILKRRRKRKRKRERA